MTLSPLLGAVGIIIFWHIRSPLLILIFISVAFPSWPLGIGMRFRTLLSPLLRAPKIELLSLLTYGLISMVMVLVKVNNSDSDWTEFIDNSCSNRWLSRVLSALYHRISSSRFVFINNFTPICQPNITLSNKVVLSLLYNLTPDGICNIGCWIRAGWPAYYRHRRHNTDTTIIFLV